MCFSCMSICSFLTIIVGLPDAVGFHPLEACNSSIDLTWDRPFTLDDRVVTYCMEIIVTVDNQTLFSQCGINDTSFTYQLPPRRSCNNFSFIVKPVNGAGNGTAFVQPYFCCQSPGECTIIRMQDAENC